jgi:uncharacterized protein YciI
MKRILIAVAILFSLSPVLAQEMKSYVFVFLNKKDNSNSGLDKAAVDKLMEGHMANLNRLAKEGKLLAAGPFDGGGGLFIFNTTSIDEAREWLSTDPGVQAKRWDVEIYDYTPRVGGICKVSEPYEMTNYSFIRFSAQVSKFTASTYPQIIKKHDDYLKQLVNTGNVVTEAIFGPNDGGVLVMKGDVQKSVFEQDPGVQEGLIDLTIKKLFIAKGSFCEK